MKQKLIFAGYLFLLAAFTVYVVADTFLIPHSMAAVTVQAAEIESAGAAQEEVVEQSSETGSQGFVQNDTAAGEETAQTDAAASDNAAQADDTTSASAMQPGSHGPGGSSHYSGASGGPSSQTDEDATAQDVSDTIVSDTSTAAAADTTDTGDAVVTQDSYSDENIQITLTTYREYDTDIYVADVTVSSPEYLKTALAYDTYGRNIKETCSQIADGVGAILAINGDYYGSQESGYVLRNGVLYRSTASRDQEDLVIWQDGSFSIITEDEVSAEDLLDQGAQQILSFGPALLTGGQIQVTTNDEVGKARTSNPRTAIGIVDENHYLLVVADGRTSASAGLSLLELAEFMQSLGADTAYNLDGGGSSTMVFMGDVVNNPTSSGRSIKEREISDIVYIG